jgi:hypothetical protein
VAKQAGVTVKDNPFALGVGGHGMGTLVPARVLGINESMTKR